MKKYLRRNTCPRTNIRTLMKNKKGFMFVTVIVIAMVMVFIAVSASNMLLQDIHMIRHLKYSTQAQYLAEAGISDALATLATTGCSELSSSGNLGEGTYSVSVSSIGGRWLVSSIGTVKGVSRTVTVEVRDLYPPALNNALSAGSDVDIKSVEGDITIKGDIHANGDLLLKEQGSPTLIHVQAYGDADGNATCSGSYSKDGNVTVDGDELEGQPMLPQPTFDFAYFKQVAQDEGNYISSGPGSYTFENESITGGTAGITYVDDDVIFRGTCTITGGFVAKGDITLDSGNTLTQVHDKDNRFPIFLSQEGNRMKLYGRFDTQEGNIVYATNNVKIQTPGGESTVLGTVCAGGWFEIVANNDLTITYDKVVASEVVPEGVEIVSWNR